ncbi:hypothetical protein D3C84_862000 [compost metagenome]
MVITRHHQHAAVRMRTRDVAVLERVAGTVDTRPLAVPDGEYAVLVGLRCASEHLRAPHRGGGQIFVDARLEQDVVLVEQLLHPPQFQVVAAQRRAPITGDEASGIQTGLPVDLALEHRHADEGLGSGQQNCASLGGVFIL